MTGAWWCGSIVGLAALRDAVAEMVTACQAADRPIERERWSKDLICGLSHPSSMYVQSKPFADAMRWYA